jgi:hypothetical protein
MSTHPDTFVIDDALNFEEQHQANEATLRARAWNSNLIAAFRTAKNYFAGEFGDKLREAYGDEWAKVLDRAFEVYAALIDAAAEVDEMKAAVRRFRLPAWKAQTFLSRTTVPKGLDKEGFQRFSEKMGRAWRRYGWGWVHKLQCVIGLALFEREAVEFKANHEAKAAAYTDRFTDLLTATILHSRRLRRKRVDRFEVAFAHCLSEFRADGRVLAYAPEWPLEVAIAPVRMSAEVERENDGPTVEVEKIARRAASRTVKIAAQLSEDEADALGVAALQWFTEEWEKRSGRRFTGLPVYIVADSENSGMLKTRSRAHQLIVKMIPFRQKVKKRPHRTRTKCPTERRPSGVSSTNLSSSLVGCV